MPLTEEQQKALILSEIGQTANLTLAAQIEIYWEKHASSAPLHEDMRYLLVLKDSVRWLMGQNWTKHMWREGDVEKHENQKMQNLLLLLNETKATLAQLKADLRSGGAVQVGYITARTPEDYSGLYVDPNDPALRGHPVHS